MAKKINIYLVRHGTTGLPWGREKDPALNKAGEKQAERFAERVKKIGPIQIISSPYLRAKQTAEPLAKLWKQAIVVEDRICEIPSPSFFKEGPSVWLEEIFQNQWKDLNGDIRGWKANIVNALTELNEDSILFTHFLTITAAYSEIAGDDKVVNIRPGNCSIAHFIKDKSSLSFVELNY